METILALLAMGGAMALSTSLRIMREYERAVVFRLGRVRPIRGYARQAKTFLATPGGRTFRKGNSLTQPLFVYLDSLPESERDFDLRLENVGES